MIEWVSVDIALPPPFKDVLVADWGGERAKMRVCCLNNEPYDDGTPHWLPISYRVTHWTPLPEPPDAPKTNVEAM